MKSRSKKMNIAYYLIVAFLATMVVVFSLTYKSGSYFSDQAQKDNSGNYFFGAVSLTNTLHNTTSPYSNNLFFTPTELLPNNDATVARTLLIENSGTIDSFVRFAFSITIDGNDVSSLVTLTSVKTNNVDWKVSSGKYVYSTSDVTPTARALFSGATIVVDLGFVVDQSFGNDYENKNIVVTFVIDAVQAMATTQTISTVQWGS